MDYITTRATINKGMKRILLLTILTVFLGSLGYGQTEFYKVANTAWNASGTWSLDGETPITCGSCVEGEHYPGPNDLAYIIDGFVSIPSGVTARVGYLLIQYNLLNAVRRGGLTGTRELEVYGYITSVDFEIEDLVPPTTVLVPNTVRVVFTGEDPLGENLGAILSWSENFPIANVAIRQTGPQPVVIKDDMPIGANITVQSGTLQIESGAKLLGSSATLVVNTGATLNVLAGGSIQGSSSDPTSFFSTAQISGLLRTFNHANFFNFNLLEGGVLENSFTGANQTQGWWYQSSIPNVNNFHPTSIVNYNANNAQNIGAIEYGNLIIGGSPISAVTKNLTSTGSLIIRGDLSVPSSQVTFNSNTQAVPISVGGNIMVGGIWSPNQLIELNGSGEQNISGSGTFSFGNGLTINKSGGTVTLQRDIDVTNGLTMLGGQLNFGTGTLRLLSGDLTMQGTSNFVTGDGVLQIHSTTNSLGTVNPNFPNLTILSGATLNHARPMNISGHLTLNGTLNLPNTNQAILTFNGTGFPQNVSGSTVLNVRDLIALNDVNINSTVNVNGKLELGEGVDFDADGSGGGLFTLKADIGGLAGYVAEIPVGSRVLGNVSYERQFSNTVRRWRNIAMPVQGVTVADLQQSFLISGNFTGSDNGTNGIPVDATGSLAFYTENAIGTVDDGWEYFPTTTNAAGLTNRRGYSAFMRDVAGNDNINIRVRGVINYGDQPMSVTYTNHGSLPDDGWNLVANPFPAPIEWGAGITKNANIGNVAYVWNASAGTYSTLNYGSGGKIASGQAFWVKANGSLGANSLVITESAKVNERNTPFRRVSENPDDRLVINLVGGTNSDPTVIQFSRLATDDFDGEYDGFKLRNEIFNLASVGFNGYKYAINHLAKNECSKSVPLSITNIQTGTYRLDFEGVFSFGSSKITLVDNYLGEETILNEGASYAFAVTSDPSSFGDARFVLEFDLSGLLPNVRIEGAQLVSESETGNQWFRNGELIPGATGQTYSPTESGLYYVEVTKNGCTGTSEAREFAVTSLGEGEFLTQGTLSVYPNPVTEAFSLGMVDEMVLPEGAPMILMNMNGQKVKEFYYTASYNRYDISNLPRGVYMLNVESGNHSRKIRVIKH
jgi:hypothetical protein